MSTRQAVAAVTAVFSDLVGRAIDGALPGSKTTNLRPGLAVNVIDPPSVNIYLYRAEPNASLRNLVDPTRTSDGRTLRRPVAAWDLHYLLTCVGDEEELEPDLLLGAVLAGLNANTSLSSGFVESVLTALASESGNRRFAADSGLAQQIDVVRLTPIDLSLDALTQLWSSLTKEAYSLSIAYQVGAVLMESEATLKSPLPVAGGPRLSIATLNAPYISSVGSSDGPYAPLLIGSTLIIEGQRLRGEQQTQLRLGSLDIELQSSQMRPGRIELPLSPTDGGGVPQPRPLAPGVLGVQVHHQIDISDDPATPALRTSARSNLLPIVLRPVITGDPAWIVDAAGDANIAIVIAPEAQEDWQYALVLNERAASEPRSLVLAEWSIAATGGVRRLIFEAAGVPRGSWLVRVQVNGAESPLLRDAGGMFANPRVDVP